MKKEWNVPVVEELNIAATAYDPEGGTVQDGVYQNYDTGKEDPFFRPSGSEPSPDTPIDRP